MCAVNADFKTINQNQEKNINFFRAGLAPSLHLATLRRSTRMGLSLWTGKKDKYIKLHLPNSSWYSLDNKNTSSGFWRKMSWRRPPVSWSAGWRSTLPKALPSTMPWSTTIFTTHTFSVSQTIGNYFLFFCIRRSAQHYIYISDLTKHPNFLAAASQILDSPRLRLFSSRWISFLSTGGFLFFFSKLHSD